MLNTHEPHRAVVSSIYITNNTTCSTGSELISNGEIIFQLASQIFVSCWLYDHIYMYYSHHVVIRMSNAGIHCYQLRKPCFPAMNFYCYILLYNNSKRLPPAFIGIILRSVKYTSISDCETMNINDCDVCPRFVSCRN